NPEDKAGEQQQEAAPEETPEEGFLAGVEPSFGRQLIVLVADVVLQLAPPLPVVLRAAPLGVPGANHPQHREEEDHAGPRMQLAGDRGSAEADGDPEQPGGPEGEAGEQEV